ncbi:hypothetical protein WR25_01456 [Diploscapter pachys]|uniref:Uncharacterized protein n=1 Tax=Diploscapter pachys TaxID=2018661 RepID=A0A2A2LTY4_9BILA|nr:hypothetical protein WR25_01456 [Diploscapter pachys]
MDILRSPLFSLWNSIIRLFYSAKKVVKDGGKDDERRAEVEDEKAKHQTDLEHDVNKPQRTVQTMKDEYEKRLNEINRQSRMQADSHKEQVAQMQQYAQRDAEKYQRAMQAMKEEYERKLDEINRQSRMQADSHKEQVAQIQQDAQRDAEKHQRAMQAMKEGYERKLDEIYRQGQMQAASCNSQVAQMQQDGQPSECQQVANTHNEQKDLAELRAKLDAMGGEHNMLQALLSLHIIANQCFELINKFQESYDTMAEKKKAAKSVEALVSSNLLGSHLAKAELNDAEGAHRAMKDLLIPALHKLMTAFTSFSAATGSIQLRDASVGQVTTVIIDFEIHIRDLTDEVSKTSNMQIKEVKQHEVEMRLLLKELSDKLKPDANDRLEA